MITITMDPESYFLAKQKLCDSNWSVDKLNILKEFWKNDINSPRRLSNIQSVTTLLVILEKRGIVSCKNPDALSKIAVILNVELRLVESPTRVLNFNPSTPREQIYNLVCSEIGKKWKDLARALELKEGEIDDLEQLHPTIPLRVKEILLFYEKYNANDEWFGLLDALSASRRKDLRNEVQKILIKK